MFHGLKSKAGYTLSEGSKLARGGGRPGGCWLLLLHEYCMVTIFHCHLRTELRRGRVVGAVGEKKLEEEEEDSEWRLCSNSAARAESL